MVKFGGGGGDEDGLFLLYAFLLLISIIHVFAF